MSPERQRALQTMIAEIAERLGVPPGGDVFVSLDHESSCAALTNPARGLDVCDCPQLTLIVRTSRTEKVLHEVWIEGDEGPEPMA